ncbi:MAG: 50S ribosomal protein L31e [Candidatus Nanoarchaeia archaeon]|jgi:large subunit ribosomal protein L31e|nr:50S ribosomal protein L31e [Candidatus Nanoarchaeia archaeon]|tara:strand:- start:23807 stop:24364 length:558 start_codon:yes stop_codon:yes gene_type:complete
MVDNERLYTIPLRKEFLKVPRYQRTKKAVKAIRYFAQKHMKTPVVKIGPYLNELMLARGRKNPPHKIQVKIIKEEDKDKKQISRVELASIPVRKAAEEKKKLAQKVKDAVLKPKETKEEPKKETKIEEHKKEEAKEKKEVLETKAEDLKKSQPKQKQSAKIPEKAHAHRKQEKVIGGEGGQKSTS